MYENRKYIESEIRKVLKRNLNSEKQAAINSQDLDESFVESLQDDFDDNVKVRFGRGLKAVNEAIISDSNETHDQEMTNATNINSKFHNFSQIFHDNSSVSQNWYNNISADLINLFNVHHDASERRIQATKIQEPILINTNNIADSDEDLEAAEQKYVHNQTARIKRAAASYRTFYDDVGENLGDSDEADKSLSDHFQLPSILEDQSDSVYDEYTTTNCNDAVQDFDRYLETPRINSRKKEKFGKKIKNKQSSSQKHAKKNSHSSPNRNRRHHTHRSDVSRNTNRDDLKPKKSKAKASSSTGKRSRIQKSKTAEQSPHRAEVNEESPGEKVLYENAEDQSVSERTIGDRRIE